MIAFLNKLWRDSSGNTLAIAAAALPIVLASAGLATDTIQWTLWKRQLQRAADSAAMAGVYTRMKNDSQDAVTAAVEHDNDLNLHTWMGLKADPDVELLADDGDKKKPVRVTLQVQHSLPFSSIFMTAAPVIRAVSTAASVPGAAEYCVIGLDPSAKVTGIDITGSTDLDLGDCSLIANSANPTTAANNGTNSASGGQGSIVHAKSLDAAGGVNYSKSWDIDNYNPYSAPIDDPYSSTPIPSSSSCTRTITLDGSVATDRSAIDKPGDIVCISNVKSGKPSGLTISNTLQLGSATYVINGGDLTMNSSNTSNKLLCDSCTVIMTNFADRTKTGNIKLTGGTIDVSAPATDGETYKGMVFIQDPLAKDSGQKTQNQISGNSSSTVQGVVYVPNQSLLYNGGGSTDFVCLQLVAKRVEFSGSSNIKAGSQCPDAGYEAIGGGSRVRLVA